MISQPIVFTWDGQVMVPRDRRFAYQCDRQFVVGEQYTLIQNEDRSSASHRHYFAAITEAWRNLPEHLGDRFPSAEHLRKFALVKAGYRDERTHVAATKAEALRLAAFIKPIDDFAIVTTSGLSVTVWTAKSQSVKAMGKAEFQRSKEAVIQVLADLLEVDVKELSDRATEAA